MTFSRADRDARCPATVAGRPRARPRPKAGRARLDGHARQELVFNEHVRYSSVMASGSRPIVSRRERPAKPALTREGIVAAAVGVMQAEGLDRVTMRRLAQELDTGAASLYVYVRNTAELHAAMLEELLGQVDLSPVTAAGDWSDRLIKVLWSYTRILFEQPGLAQSALVTRPYPGPPTSAWPRGYWRCSVPAACLRTGQRGRWTCCCTSRPRPPPSRAPVSARSTRKTKKTHSWRRYWKHPPTPSRT